mgnify:CR=1 FL=1
MQGTDHSKQIHRLNRVEGQIRGVKKMVENHEYCVDILHQVRAIRSSLKGLEQVVLKGHLEHCVHSALSGAESEKSQEEMIEEILQLFKNR